MIAGEKTILHPLDRRHLDATLGWANDPGLIRLLDRARPIEPEEHLKWFESLPARSESEIHFAIEVRESGDHIGNVWLRAIDRRNCKAEVSILIGARSAQGRGFGVEAIRLIVDHAFRELGLNRVYANVLKFNEPARKAFERAGFSVEGVLRSDRNTADGFVDVTTLGKLA